MSTRMIAFLSLILLGLPSADASITKLKDRLANQADALHGSKLDRMSDNDLDRMAENIEEKAEEIEYDSEPEFGEHIEDTWRAGASEGRSHIRKCPYCNDAARDVARGTSVSGNVPSLSVPNCLVIGGEPFGVGPRGQLFGLHPATGQQISGAVGIIWFQGGQYYGVEYGSGNPWPASTC